MKTFKKFNEYISIKNISYTTIILNSVSLILGIIYILIQNYNIFWDIFGVILLVTIFTNIILVYLNGKKLNKRNRLGNRLNILCYIFLIFLIFSMLGMVIGNLLISVTYSNDLKDTWTLYTMVYFNYFGLLAFGFLIALLDIKNLNNNDIWNLDQKSINKQYVPKFIRLKKNLKIILKIICYLTFILGVIFAILTLTGSFMIIGLLAPQFGVFFTFIFLSNTVILLKLNNEKKKPKRYKKIVIIGVITSGILMLPLCLTQYAIFNAERNFSNAFGEDWRDKIPQNVEDNYFLKTPFSTPGYFLGIPPKDCIINENMRYYKGEGVELYFDSYIPPENPKDLPGEGSILIKIHGGGWVFGDKGWGNMMQVNKYFAAQGYYVFDVQYGLYDMEALRWDPLTPEHTKGNFDVDDMVRHLGIFCKYIVNFTNNNDDYKNINFNSVFISGGSAGGHLTCAVALAIESGEYTDWFGTNLSIVGYVPFYPASGMEKYFDNLGGSEELVDPIHLIDKDSPPCLIFQGTQDILARFDIAKNFREKYLEEGNKECAIIWLPLAGHANDIYFSGYYNLVFLYYWERFMYIYH